MADFFSKVKESLNKGVTTLNVKTKEIVGATAIKSEIDLLNKRKVKALEELGDVTYNMYLQKNFDEDLITKQCLLVFNIDELIDRKKEELRLIYQESQESLNQQGLKCECGAIIGEVAKFCSSCGQKIDIRVCSCGQRLPENSKFCTKCGLEARATTG